MDFQAKCIQFLGETSGTSKAGNPWRKKEWVVETFGQYPRKVKVQCFGDRSASMNLEPNRNYVLSVDLESREFNGRWYTDVSVYRVEEMTGDPNFPQNNPGGGFNQPQYAPQQSPMNAPYGGNQGGFGGGGFVSESSDEDLPF